MCGGRTGMCGGRTGRSSPTIVRALRTGASSRDEGRRATVTHVSTPRRAHEKRTGTVRLLGQTGAVLETSARLLRLLSLLQSRPEWSGPDLAERLGVTT